MRASIFIAALVAALVGFGGTVAIVFSAAEAVNASQAQTASWVAGLGIAIAINATILSVWMRAPVTTAWSSPGAALIATTTGYSFPEAVGAFLFCAALLMLTATFGILRRLVSAIPMPLANAMLAGVLFGYIILVFDALNANPALVLPMVALFFVVRLWSASWASIFTLIFGLILAFALGQATSVPALQITQLVLVMPDFNWAAMISLGLPLYLVTMAGQNLPGLAVLRAAGYDVDTRPILGLTGLVSALTAFIGCHASNLAAITAAICTGPDAHPDKDKRWMTGPALGAIYLVIALFSGWLVAFFGALPGELIIALAAVALSGALLGALSGAMADEPLRFPALMTFLVTLSGITFFGLGGAFWGLAVGLGLWGLQRLKP